MAVQADPNPDPEPGQRLRLRRLLPPGEPATVAQTVEQLGLWERHPGATEHQRVLLNMVSTVDGRATLGGHSAPLSGRADRELFHGLRSAADAILVGAGTVRMERYGRIIKDESVRRLRRERGLSEEPLACIVSGRLALEADIPLLADPQARVVIVTASAASLPATGAAVEYVRAERDGRLDLPAALAELRSRFGLEMLLCEGGPHLSLQLFAAGLIDELFLSLSPRLAGGEAASGEALRILAGPELEPPRSLRLLGALECESALFLRYGVSDGVSAARPSGRAGGGGVRDDASV
ncbi:MAG: bifunctional deaminase-reductase domain protein [Solirubrobacterales bacterium]|jgi:riboflavin biosynthesis pyrimidine reductase|nr:bifunctional deaminase-reductase domain protein [Solirubrobacterales bacterium]